MSELRATILHVSDLHCGSEQNIQILPQIPLIASEVAPDYLIISGDIAEHPFPWLMRRGKNLINEIAAKCNLPASQVIVIPGNHDYKFKGILGIRRLTRIPFEVYFRGEGHSQRFFKRASLYLKLTLKVLLRRASTLGEEIQVRRDEKRALALFGFNSNPLFEWFATGKISDGQIRDIRKTLGGTGKKEYLRFLKIAVVHHHPLPIPYLPTEREDRIQDSLLILYGAGTLLRELGKCGIDLILHGHRHFAGFTRVSYQLADRTRREVGVLGAGSAAHRSRTDPRGNEVNVIRVFDDDTVSIEEWYFSNDLTRKEESRIYPYYTLDDIRRIRGLAAISESGIRVGRCSRRVEITAEGYSLVEDCLEDCNVVKEEGVERYDFSLESSAPSYVRGLEVLKRVKSPKFVSLNKGKGGLRQVKGVLDFGEVRYASDGPFELGYRYKLMNGHALDNAEFKRRYAPCTVNWEYASVEAREATRAVRLTVKFPDSTYGNTIEGYGAEALYPPNPGTKSPNELLRQHASETARVRDSVEFSGQILTLDVPAPVPNFVYRIRWKYRELKSAGVLSRTREATLQLVRRRLISFAKEAASRPKANSSYAEIVKLLDQFRHAVEERYPPIDPDETLDVSLAVFDEDRSVLSFVAAIETPIDVLLKYEFMSGEGCLGFAFEKGRVVFFDKSRDDFGQYLSLDELRVEDEAASVGESPKEGISRKTLAQHEAIIAVPWIDESGMILGVLSIGSASKSSRLLNVFPSSGLGKKGSEQLKGEAVALEGLTKLLGESIIYTVTKSIPSS